MRVEVRRIGAIKDGESTVGNRTRVKVVKNKVAAPFREAEFDIIYGQGISREGDLLDLAAANNIVEKSGSWYSFENERIGQGRDNAKNFLKENPEKLEKIDRELRKALGLLSTSPVERSLGAAGCGRRAVDEVIAARSDPKPLKGAFHGPPKGVGVKKTL